MTTATLMKTKFKRAWLSIQRFSLLLIDIHVEKHGGMEANLVLEKELRVDSQVVIIEHLSPHPHDTIFEQGYTCSNKALLMNSAEQCYSLGPSIQRCEFMGGVPTQTTTVTVS